MIAVDTSALLAIAQREPEADDCSIALQNAERVLISAGTLTEALIVSERRRVAHLVESMVEDLRFEIIPVSPATARRVAEVYRRWGKGFHPAALNFGDCFAYEVARSHDYPLLYVGQDFARTDIRSALVA